MTRAWESWLWVTMRLTSMVLAVAVIVHLITMIYAIQGGLSAQEILARTEGSVAWYSFYLVFLLAAMIHASIGLRNIIREHTAWRNGSLDLAALVFACVLMWMGVRSLGGLF